MDEEKHYQNMRILFIARIWCWTMGHDYSDIKNFEDDRWRQTGQQRCERCAKISIIKCHECGKPTGKSEYIDLGHHLCIECGKKIMP